MICKIYENNIHDIEFEIREEIYDHKLHDYIFSVSFQDINEIINKKILSIDDLEKIILHKQTLIRDIKKDLILC